MHPRLTELLELADRERAALLETVRAVPAERVGRRPTPDGWSVVEVLDHLHHVETSIARLLTARIAEAREAGLGSESSTESLAASLDRYEIADRGRRLEAPPRLQPRADLTLDGVVDALARSREALRAAAAAGNGYALADIKHPHPVLGPIDAYQWILFVAHHERRHAGQVREIAGAIADA